MNEDIKDLINSFKEYRDLLSPIEENLKSFSSSFDSIREDISNLSIGSDGSIQNKLDKIYKELSSQSDKAKNLASGVDKFMSSTSKYVDTIDSLVKSLTKIEKSVENLNSIEGKAESQIERLNSLIEDKKKNYDVRQLEKKLDNYSDSVQKINDYINGDVVEVISKSHEKISQIQDKNKSIYESVSSEQDAINKLIEEYQINNNLLRKVVECNDVNVAYLYDILDKWAEDRRVKTKK